MEIQQIKGFVSVVRYGSFSEAALKTYRTQPAITLQIKNLEVEFETKLFERVGSRNIALTEEGRLLYELVSPFVDDVDTLKSRFNEARKNSKGGSVRIATHNSVITHLLPEIIEKFRQNYTDVRPTILSRMREDILQMLRNGEADLGITSLSSIPTDIDYKVFAKYNRILIFPKRHPLAKKKRIGLKDLAGYPLIIAPKGSNTRATIDKAFTTSGLNYDIAIEVTGKDAVKSYVAMGMGISVLNDYYITKEDRKILAIRDASSLFDQAERGIVVKKGKYLSKAAREFIVCVQDRQ